MSAKPLQSSLANNFWSHRYALYIKWGAIVIGVLAVLVGLADVTSRVANATLGERAGETLFAPAGAIGNPEILDALGRSPTGEAVHAAEVPANFAPVRIKVPSVGIDAAVEAVGVRADGAMATPKKFEEVAWYSPGGRPGSTGSAVFAGHVNNALTQSGAFAHLMQVKIGDYITVADKEGRTLVYKVQALDQYSADEVPPQSIFTTVGPSRLVLITCDGDWVPAQKTFDKRLVITAVPSYR